MTGRHRRAPLMARKPGIDLARRAVLLYRIGAALAVVSFVLIVVAVFS